MTHSAVFLIQLDDVEKKLHVACSYMTEAPSDSFQKVVNVVGDYVQKALMTFDPAQIANLIPMPQHQDEEFVPTEGDQTYDGPRMGEAPESEVLTAPEKQIVLSKDWS